MCMSADPVIVPTVRPAWIEFEYLDEDAIVRKWNTRDNTDTNRMMNRVFQHEIAHTQGIINIDLVKDPSRIILDSNPSFYDKAEFTEVA